jgi:hypothetical protein
VILVLAVLALIGARSAASYLIDYAWWKEMGQVGTWLRMLAYGTAPVAGAALAAFVCLWIAHARALKWAGTGLGEHPLYAKISAAALLLVGIVVSSATVDGWTVMRWVGSSGAPATTWNDPVFGRPLSFYFFDLPFYGLLLRFLLTVSFLAALTHWATSRAWSLKERLRGLQHSEGQAFEFDVQDLRLGELMELGPVRIAAAVFFLALAARFFLDRYDLMFEDHASLVGVDWVAEHISLPLLWISIAGCLLAAAGFLARRLKLALLLPAALLVYFFLPRIAAAVYVRPSEITIQRAYIERHIEATRSAWGIGAKTHESEFEAQAEAPVVPAKHKQLLDNVRLWDWRAFHDTVTQIQALRPYYVFQDSDVDRYMIGGQIRQLLLSPREIDVTQLPGDARSRWINPHFIYTHGYGLVVAEAARITQDGLPHLLVGNAPPEVRTPDLKLTRPEIYYGEVTHDPVFVHTRQPEFDYPSGAGNVETRYAGKGGFPIGGRMMRLASAIATGDWNILLTSYMVPESRMMIRRKVKDRLQELAGFLAWDSDPYLVITPEGRLVWLVDGYSTSESHPYSRTLSVSAIGQINYIRNSVKAAVDAYDGTVRLYVFDEADPVLAAYRNLFPGLFTPASEMPAGLKAHTRYPETIFRLQAEIYRTYHMRNPESFFNREDQWDLAKNINGPGGRSEPVSPTYLVATLPDSDKPEFLLMTTFTPRNKDNLIGIMVARCDGASYGEIHVLQLSKQQLIFGPMQIEARISQDQVISKDLTLWNQQGSEVLRGQMMVLPIERTLLYIEPIYIQASQARMPQLKKVVMAHGNRLIYADTYEAAVAELAGASGQSAPAEAARPATPAAPVPGAQSEPAALDAVREHLRRYRDYMAQGKYSEAGRELEAIEQLTRRR